jgi:alanyl-tRNA synthetase
VRAHPDIEEVGKTTRHGTFFEMCGNFSFGDYFKEGAIELAWELVTKSQADGGFGLDPSRLWPDVYEDDDEAVAPVAQGHRPARRADRPARPKENYWSMGVPGPGGPCSEILYDRGPEYGPDGTGREDRYLEIWNLVFMQDELSAVRSKDDFDIAARCRRRTSTPAWASSGSRTCCRASRQHVRDRRDVFPVIEKAEELTGKPYGADHEDDVRFRVVADHVRSSMMLIGDGVTPGNEGRGYVLRRLLRRAVRSMRLLGYEDRCCPSCCRSAATRWAETYPELHRTGTASRRSRTPRRRRSARPCKAGTHDLRPGGAEVKKSGGTTLSGDRRSRCTTPTASRSTSPSRWRPSRGSTVDEVGFRG